MNFKNLKFILITILITILIATCSAQTSDLNQCQIDCSTARIPGQEMFIKNLTGGDITYACNTKAVVSVNTPATLTFGFYYPTLDSTTGTTAGATSSTKKTPVGGVKFVPTILGTLSPEKTNPEFAKNPKYFGVNTPSSEWCSDSCGIAQIDVSAICVGVDNTVTIGMRAGAAVNNEAGTQEFVKITTKAPTTSSTP